jgi:hypothetical protein
MSCIISRYEQKIPLELSLVSLEIFKDMRMQDL